MKIVNRCGMEAIQYDGSNAEEVANFCDGSIVVHDEEDKGICLAVGFNYYFFYPCDWIIKNPTSNSINRLDADAFDALCRKPELSMSEIEREAERFFEWPTDCREAVTLTSCLLFARHIAWLQSEGRL